MAWGALIAGGASVAGGAMGAAQSAEDRRAAKAAYDASVRDLESIGIPSIEAQRLVFEDYKSQGKLTPELEEAIKLGDSEMLGISLDPTYKEAQLAALAELQGIGESGGMRLSDKASLEKTLGDLNAEERGHREAILADSRSKGQMGSGSELAAQLLNQQESAGRAHQAGLSIQAEAQKRALDAIMQGGQLAGNIRSQDFSEKEKAAQAQDAIRQWNAANAQAVRQRNTGNLNTAQEYNLGSAQRIADANVDNRNKATTHNTGLAQTNFENQLNVNAAKANARSGQASNLNASADRTAGQWAGIGAGVGQAATAASQQYRQDERYDDYMNRAYPKKKE